MSLLSGFGGKFKKTSLRASVVGIIVQPYFPSQKIRTRGPTKNFYVMSRVKAMGTIVWILKYWNYYHIAYGSKRGNISKIGTAPRQSGAIMFVVALEENAFS